jgi:hypothetical protein
MGPQAYLIKLTSIQTRVLELYPNLFKITNLKAIVYEFEDQ